LNKELLMSRTWQLQQAKSRFSELVNKALREGPQIITRHGDEVAVIIAYSEFARLQKPQGSLVDFFRASPLAEVELDIERDRNPARPGLDL
jgi:prevent-host-death family protein